MLNNIDNENHVYAVVCPGEKNRGYEDIWGAYGDAWDAVVDSTLECAIYRRTTGTHEWTRILSVRGHGTPDPNDPCSEVPVDYCI